MGSGQLESFTHTVPVRRLTCSIWPWMPRQSSTSPCSPGRNQNWLRYHPPGKDASAGDSRKASVPSASTAQARRSHLAGTTVRQPPSPSGTTPPSSSICPNRSRSRAVAASPPSCTAVPSPSQMISASARRPSAPRPAPRPGRPSGRRRPARRPSRARRSRRSGRGTGSRAAPRHAASRGTGRARVRALRTTRSATIHRSSWRTSASGLAYSSRNRTPLRMSSRCWTVAPAYPLSAELGNVVDDVTCQVEQPAVGQDPGDAADDRLGDRQDRVGLVRSTGRLVGLGDQVHRPGATAYASV